MHLTSKTKRRQSQSNGTINRVRSGCVTCKRRKVKCDEGRPACDRCKRGGHNCLGYVNASDLSRLTATEATGTDRCNSERLLTTEIDYASTLAHSLDSLDRMPESRQITVAEIDSIDPALLDASTDSAWHTLLNSLTLWQESETANLSEHNCSIPIIDVSFDSGINHDDEEELISSARAAYDKSIMNLNLHSRKAYDRSLKWFPPAFSKYKGQAQSSFFCQLEKEPWSRAFLHLSAASSMIRSFLVSIGTLYGPAPGEEQCEVLDVNPIESKNLGKQEYGRAMKALQSLRARVARLQRQHEWSRLDFCITIQFIAAVILFMLYEELDRSMVENGIGIWSHAVTVALQMPELYFTHPFSLRCNFQDHNHENFKRLPLCGTLEKEDFDNFRILIKIIYWKDTLYRVTGSGAGTAAKSSSLIANIRAWEKSDLFAQPEDLRSNLLSSMALWTPELLDIVACATQKSTSADRGLIDQLLCRTRMARFWSDMIEDEELTNRKSIVFEALRFTVQILVMLTLDPCTKLKEIDFLRIQASLRICHVATSHEAARHEWNNLTTISTETIFDDVQYSLHLHLAFPFLLASTQIESSDLQHALLVSLQRLSSEEHHARVADRGRDSILFLRLILKEVYNISNHVRQKEGVTLKTTITAAIKGCHFAEETQLLAT